MNRRQATFRGAAWVLTALLTGATPWLAAPQAEAQGLIDRRPRDRDGASGGYSLDDAVELAQSRFNAKAVKAEVIADGGRRVYSIRLLNAEGRVWTVRVDAATGRLQ